MRTKLLAAILVAVVVIAGVGMSLLYVQGQDTLREKERLAVHQDMRDVLGAIDSQAYKEVALISQHLRNASLQLRTTGLDGEDARAVLSDLMANMTHVIDVVTINRTGFIVTAWPTEYSDVEGVDISNQSQVQRMLRTMMPVMSEVFVLEEGMPASDLEVPVFDAENRFNGSVSAAIDLSAMMEDIVGEHLDLDKYQFTCLQTDGTQIFDTDEAQVGKNLFTDPAYANYTETLEFMRKVIADQEGYGTYEYYRSLETKDLVNKEVYWSSFRYNGADWRLLVIHVI